MAAMATAWRSFWHTMTSNDRHASHDSISRTGNHTPSTPRRHAPLTSIAKTAAESRVDLTSTYNSDGAEQQAMNKSPTQSQGPYVPGMRSSMQRKQSDDASANGEIQMQNFQEGLPPPPPVAHSWKRIDRWTEEHYQELFDNLGEACTQNDINELEHELDCTLPQEVRESLQCHDGQERGGRPSGIIFGCMLLDAEEIVQEWNNWRTVGEEYLSRPAVATTMYDAPQVPSKAFAGPSSSTESHTLTPQTSNASWREELLARQDSQPANAVAKAYVHPAWIPLARDWGGNNLAVDLAPGPAGKWGQVILMGRDYDCKYVVARSWAALLATVADDLSSDKVFVREDTGELKLREFKQPGVEPAYIDILRWRADQKYGRKGMRRKSAPTNGPVGPRNSSSPYSMSAASVASDSERGRSKAPAGPPGRAQRLSPLARVSEEPVAALRTYVNGGPSVPRKNSLPVVEKLISTATTPRVSVDGPGPVLLGKGGVPSLVTADGVLASSSSVPRASSPLKQSHENSFSGAVGGKENVAMANGTGNSGVVKGLGIVDGKENVNNGVGDKEGDVAAKGGFVVTGDDDDEGDGEMKTVEI